MTDQPVERVVRIGAWETSGEVPPGKSRPTWQRERIATFGCRFWQLATLLDHLAREWPAPTHDSAAIVNTWKRAHPQALLAALHRQHEQVIEVSGDDPKSWRKVLDAVVDRSTFFEVHCCACDSVYPKAVLRFRDVEEFRGPLDGYGARLLECPQGHLLHTRGFWQS